MTETQVLYFFKVVEKMSFTKAAEELYVTQPAISKHISSFEEELGVSLFVRAQNGLRITSAGQLIHDFLKDYRTKLADIVAQAQELDHRKERLLRLGFLDKWDLKNFYPKITQLLNNKHPELNITLESYNGSKDILSALDQGYIDIMFAMYDSSVNGTNINLRKLTHTKNALLYSCENPLAKKQNLTLSDFKYEPIYVLAGSSRYKALQNKFRVACQNCGFAPQIISVHSFSTAIFKIQSGNGALFIDEWMFIKISPLFKCYYLNFPFDIGIGWLRCEGNEMVESLANEIIDGYKDDKPACI